jgi:hypothetical protein
VAARTVDVIAAMIDRRWPQVRMNQMNGRPRNMPVITVGTQRRDVIRLALPDVVANTHDAAIDDRAAIAVKASLLDLTT